MDDARYGIREFADADFDAFARIRQRTSPGTASTAAELRHLLNSLGAAGFLHRRFVAWDRPAQAVVGYASIEQQEGNYHPRKYWAQVSVDPDHQGRGVGSALFARLEREARSLDALALWASVSEAEVRGVRFFHDRGFIEQRRFHRSRLDLGTVPDRYPFDRTEALEKAGIAITTLREEGPERSTVRDRLYDLRRATATDLPVLGEATPMSFEQFVRDELEGPGFLPEGTFLARVGEVYVGVTSLTRSATGPPGVHVGFTGVRREYRGKGIATTLKARSIDFARRAGLASMDTGNDDANRPIRSINERLGFRTFETLILGEKPYPGTGEGAAVAPLDRRSARARGPSVRRRSVRRR